MALEKTHHYTDDNGIIISASQAHLLNRRKRCAELFREMKPRYATYQVLFYDIAQILTREGMPCNFNTVRNDLRAIGLVFNTKQTRMPKTNE